MSAILGAARYHLVLAAYFVASFLFLKFVLPYILPFFLALFLAVLIDPAVTWLEVRWRIPRSLGAGLVIILLVATIAVTTVFGVVRLGAELAGLSTSLPEIYDALAALAADLADLVGEISAVLPPLLKSSLDQQITVGYRVLQTAVESLLGLVQGWLAALPALLVLLLITSLATYFISRDKDRIRDFLMGLFPKELRPGAVEVKSKLMASTVGLIKAQAVLIMLGFVIFLVGLSIIRAPYILTVSLVSALLDVIPVLGPSLIFIPWAIYMFAVGDVSFAIQLLVVYGFVALVRGASQVIVIGGRINLHPLATLLALYLGVEFFGPIGFVYGPLVAIVLKAAVEAGLLPAGPGPRTADKA